MEIQHFRTVLHHIPNVSAPREPPGETHCSCPRELEVIILSSVKSVWIIHGIFLSVDESVDAVSGPEHYWGVCSSFMVQESWNMKGALLPNNIPL